MKTESFETNRPYLLGIAYRMFGSAMDAVDMVQEPYIRFHVAAKEDILSFKGLPDHHHQPIVRGSASPRTAEAGTLPGP